LSVIHHQKALFLLNTEVDELAIELDGWNK